MEQLERRRAHRYSFGSIQWVAPLHGDKRPGPGDFVPVRCCDISKTGFSFWLDEQPDFRELVVQIQKGTGVMFIKAEVVHTKRQGLAGHERFLVGCRFNGRINV